MIKFHEHYLKWITILLKKQESCVINGGTKTRYFPLEKSTWNGGFITSRLFILVLEIVFLFIKVNTNVEGLRNIPP